LTSEHHVLVEPDSIHIILSHQLSTPGISTEEKDRNGRDIAYQKAPKDFYAAQNANHTDFSLTSMSFA